MTATQRTARHQRLYPHRVTLTKAPKMRQHGQITPADYPLLALILFGLAGSVWWVVPAMLAGVAR